MATIVPPISKRVKTQLDKAQLASLSEKTPDDFPSVKVTLVSVDGTEKFANLLIPGTSSLKNLESLLNQLRHQSSYIPYTFSYRKDSNSIVDITTDLYSALFKNGQNSVEDHFEILFSSQAVFRVRPVSRCTSTLTGHTGNIVSCSFAPFGASRLVTGSGDCCARIWDTSTETPMHTLKGHKGWVTCTEWCPSGLLIATGSMDASIIIWEPKKGQMIGSPLKRHTKPIMSLAWEPYHRVEMESKQRLVSGSQDHTVRTWFASTQKQQFVLSGHTGPVTCVRWGGSGWIYSASYDRTIRIWDDQTGQQVHTLLHHAARINHLALSVSYALRTGPYDEYGKINSEKSAEARYNEALKSNKELLVSASDDAQLCLWAPADSTKKPFATMHGHQQVVNHAAFSPDGRTIATASFDKSLRLWSARDGAFIGVLRGHVGAVYQCAWSSDSRLLVSSSYDTTLKVWDVQDKKLKADLPGHRDQIFAVDWSTDGSCVASGGADKAVKLWKH